VRKLREGDFFKLDDEETKPFSWINKKINELSKIKPLVAFFWKLILAPIWLLFVKTLPKVTIKNVNKKVHSFSINTDVDRYCIRSKWPFIYYSLARVIILDENRISRRGKKFKVLRNEINKARNLGYQIHLLHDGDGIDFLRQVHLRYRGGNFARDYLKQGDLEGSKLVVGVARNIHQELVGVSAIWISGSYASNFYYYGVEKQHIRWMLPETLIEAAFNLGVEVFQTDNLMDISAKTDVFQKALGYKTVRLRMN
jgi:hypothetical protein